MLFAPGRTSTIARILAGLVIYLTGCLATFSARAVEFNLNFVDSSDRKNIDLSRFQIANYIAPGEYLVDVLLNGRTVSDRLLVNFIPEGEDKNSRVCLPPDLVQRFDLTPEAAARLTLWHQGQCSSLDQQKEVTTRYDREKQTLNIIMPQAWLTFHDENWVPPSQWDEGVNGALLDYNLFASTYQPHRGTSSSSISSYGTAGFNLGPWRARADYQYQASRPSDAASRGKLSWNQTYLYRALPALGARLTAGQTNFSSDIFESFRFVGVTLNSDTRMLPPALRGYAPQVTGIAKTNAKVSISQNGRIIYQTNVSPGPFVIQDLTEAVQGALDVEITEEDGSVTRYQVTTASLPFLTRKGQVRFKSAMGKPASGSSNHVIQPGFFSGEMSWGALNNLSLYGGLIATTGSYQALAMGIGQNLEDFGAVSVDATRSSAVLPQAGKETGMSYRVNYSKRFESTGSQVTFAGYRYADRTFMSLGQYLNKVNGSGYSRDDKQTYTLSANQYLPWPAITLFLSATHNVYWNASSGNNYSLSVSKIFDIGSLRGVSATLSASKLRYQTTDENQMFLSLSLPISSGQQVSYDAQQDRRNGFSQTASWYNSQDPNNSWRVGVGGSSPDLQQGRGVFRANYQHMSPWGQLGLNGSVKDDDYRSLNANWYGSITATAAGAALHQSSAGSEPRMMIAAGVPGIPVSNGASVTNRYGIAVVNGFSSYQTSDIRIDINHLPDDVEVYNTVVSKTLTEGAIGLRQVRAVKGERMLAVIRRADGSYPPLGATVMDNSSGLEAGLVGDGGLAWLSGISGEKSLTVQWGDGQQCRIQVPTQQPEPGAQILLPCVKTQ